ncbi:PIN domain-containing protein [Mucilaginibacter sp.]|uniref:type II toxin-antitoxin system VapC family toxin n=1 Tax=Mucilaginibacter sp. TaxID=1882438 RepID=UPI0035BBDBED
MDIVLIDTSVWINYLKKFDTLATGYLENQLEQMIIATCPTILQEVLQGVLVDSDYKSLKSYFDGLLMLNNNSYELAIEAAQLYRSFKKNGITVRKPNDCLIAAYAIKNNVLLLHEDRDFAHMSMHSDLIVIKP